VPPAAAHTAAKAVTLSAPHGLRAAGAAGRMGPQKWTRPRRRQQLLSPPPWISGDPRGVVGKSAVGIHRREVREAASRARGWRGAAE
jgi:hypothetical protein